MSRLSVSCDLTATTSVDCNLVPCKVNYTGKAKVNSYFKPTISETGKSRYTGSFRGKPLDGIDLELDKDFVGVVCKKTFDSTDRVHLKPIGKFNKIKVWNWDSKPTDNDVSCQALQWLALSSAIHDPAPDNLEENEEN